MKQTIAGDKSTVRGSKKSSTLLCARKNPKKKKRNKFGANYNDDGYPHYATTAIDGRYRRDLHIYTQIRIFADQTFTFLQITTARRYLLTRKWRCTILERITKDR